MGTFPLTSGVTGIGHFTTRISCCQDETIGDEYLVVGGFTVPIASHALGVVNLAFGMGVASQEIMNPMVEEPIQVAMTEFLL